MPTRYEDVARVAHDTEHFSSKDSSPLPTPTGAKPLVAPPITSDPPFHTKARRILLPFFGPPAVAELQPKTRSICQELVDQISARLEDDPAAVIDAASEYAQHIPVRVIAHMLGVPEGDEYRFLDWAIRIFQLGADDIEITRVAFREVLAYFTEQVAQRRAAPDDDLISHLLTAEIDEEPLTEQHIVGTCVLLLMAGVDTTWSGIGASLWHLAAHSDHREGLIAETAMMDTAVEEFLRAYAPVTMAREVVAEVEVSGCPMPVGQKVLLNFPAANRDPEAFDEPNEVILDRQRNRHLAFGVGIHRCLGSNLARMEIRTALETWLSAFPDFALAPDAPVVWSGAQVRGPRQVPVTIRSGDRI